MLLNKPVYLGISILELSKILIYDLWYEFVELQYGENATLYYGDPDRFNAYIKTRYL